MVVNISFVAIILLSDNKLLPLLIFPYIVSISNKLLTRLPAIIKLSAIILFLAIIFEALVIFPNFVEILETPIIFELHIIFANEITSFPLIISPYIVDIFDETYKFDKILIFEEKTQLTFI